MHARRSYLASSFTQIANSRDITCIIWICMTHTSSKTKLQHNKWYQRSAFHGNQSHHCGWPVAWSERALILVYHMHTHTKKVISPSYHVDISCVRYNIVSSLKSSITCRKQKFNLCIKLQWDIQLWHCAYIPLPNISTTLFSKSSGLMDIDSYPWTEREDTVPGP